MKGGPRPLDRRALLRGAGAVTGLGLVGLGPACRGARPTPPEAGPAVAPVPAAPVAPEPVVPEPATATAPDGWLPTPDFARVRGAVVGLRPYRRGTIRLELDRHGARPLVHAYGHGGAGITLAWGTALEVRDLVHGVRPAPARAAVLGAGVIGLTSARVLRDAGYEVSVLAAAFPPHTTSNVAGGQWSPSLVAHGRSTSERELFRRLVRRSFEAYHRLIGRGWGVVPRDNYATLTAGPGFRHVPADLVPRRDLERLPFAGPARPGRVFETLLVEPPTFLARLVASLAADGVRLVERRFASSAELESVAGDVLVDALGLGAGALFDDPAVTPLRGQLVLLEPQELPYLLSHGGYVFPRSDAVVLGGTVERDRTDTTPREATTQRLLREHAAWFAAVRS